MDNSVVTTAMHGTPEGVHGQSAGELHSPPSCPACVASLDADSPPHVAKPPQSGAPLNGLEGGRHGAVYRCVKGCTGGRSGAQTWRAPNG